MFQGLALLGIDLEAAQSGRATASTGPPRGFTWAEGLASTFDGIAHAVAGDLDGAGARFAHGLAIQESLGDREGAGVSLGGLAALAVGRGDLGEALDLYARSLAAFETIGDRAEEARVLAEMAWTHLRDDEPRPTLGALPRFGPGIYRRRQRSRRRAFAGRACRDRGDEGRAGAGRPDRGCSGGLRPAEEDRQRLLRRDAGARDSSSRARASLPAEDGRARATEIGRRLTIRQATDLARTAEVAPA